MTFNQPKPPENKVEIPRLQKDAFPARIFISLAEAAEIVGCKPCDLLHYGGIGKIGLVVSVPDDIRLYLADSYREYIPPPILCPEMLILQPSYCRQIECNGRTEQSDFTEGYIFELYNTYNNTHVKLLTPSLALSEAVSRTCVWRTGHEGIPRKIELSAEHLFVMAVDLAAFAEGKYKKAEENIPNKSKVQSYMSDKLVTLIQASTKFWGNANRNDRDTHTARNKAVAEWLVTRGFSASLADKGASIIRPEFAEPGRPPNK